MVCFCNKKCKSKGRLTLYISNVVDVETVKNDLNDIIDKVIDTNDIVALKSQKGHVVIMSVDQFNELTGN